MIHLIAGVIPGYRRHPSAHLFIWDRMAIRGGYFSVVPLADRQVESRSGIPYPGPFEWYPFAGGCAVFSTTGGDPGCWLSLVYSPAVGPAHTSYSIAPRLTETPDAHHLDRSASLQQPPDPAEAPD